MMTAFQMVWWRLLGKVIDALDGEFPSYLQIAETKAQSASRAKVHKLPRGLLSILSIGKAASALIASMISSCLGPLHSWSSIHCYVH
jgi:hypothetical protein